jgi:hypothetical protein
MAKHWSRLNQRYSLRWERQPKERLFIGAECLVSPHSPELKGDNKKWVTYHDGQTNKANISAGRGMDMMGEGMQTIALVRLTT